MVARKRKLQPSNVYFFLTKNATESNGPSPTDVIRQWSYNEGTNAASSTVNCNDST
jgi:hypothetical protein